MSSIAVIQKHFIHSALNALHLLTSHCLHAAVLSHSILTQESHQLNFNLTALLMLILYNIIFVMPLIIILVAVYFGAQVQNVHKWKQSNKVYMRLATGLVLIALGWLLMLIANGTINLN